VAEILSLLQRVPGVKYVLDVKLRTRPVVPREELPLGTESPLKGSGESLEGMEEELTSVEGKLVRVSSDTLLCSLDHEVVITGLGEEDD